MVDTYIEGWFLREDVGHWDRHDNSPDLAYVVAVIERACYLHDFRLPSQERMQANSLIMQTFTV
eukprot:3320482-Pleurochrysis_carterae.AAC.1